MGGIGSGRKMYYDAKREVEECFVLSAFSLRKHHILDEGAECHGTITTKRGSLKFERERDVLILTYAIAPKRAIRLGLRVSHTCPQFGGQRPWLHCPECDRRCGKLYLAPEQELFLCRECAHLTYQSTRENSLRKLLFKTATPSP
jgi:hypothetical protein